MGFEEARKRRTYGRARVPRFLNPLGRIWIRSSACVSFVQWSSREMVARSAVKIRSEAHPLGRFPIRSGGLNFLFLLCFWVLTWFSEEGSSLVSGALPLDPALGAAPRPRELFRQLDPIKVIEAPYSQFDP